MWNRLIAGVRCADVLAELSEFLGGQLSSARGAELRAHVSQCQACERFGADVQTALQLLREDSAPEPLSDDLSRRLAKILESL